jgi:hypothetical protein
VSLKRDLSILFSRTTIFIFLYSNFLIYRNSDLNFLNRGIDLYGGLFHVTSNTQIFHFFILLLSSIVLSLTAFYPRSINRYFLDESLSFNHIIEENNTLKASSNQEYDKNTQDKSNPEEYHKDLSNNKDPKELEILGRDLEKVDESLKNVDDDGKPRVNEDLKKDYPDFFENEDGSPIDDKEALQNLKECLEDEIAEFFPNDLENSESLESFEP